MSLTAVKLDDRQQIVIAGNVNFENVQEVCEQGKYFFNGLDKIVVDLSAIVNADSTCLAMLIDWIRSAKELHKPVEFTNPTQELLDLGRVCGLDEILPLGKELLW